MYVLPPAAAGAYVPMAAGGRRQPLRRRAPLRATPGPAQAALPQVSAPPRVPPRCVRLSGVGGCRSARGFQTSAPVRGFRAGPAVLRGGEQGARCWIAACVPVGRATWRERPGVRVAERSPATYPEARLRAPRRLLRAAQPQGSRPLLVREMLRAPNVPAALCWALLSASLSIWCWAPELGAVLQLWPHQGRAEGKNLPQPAGHALCNAPWCPVGLLGHRGTLLATRTPRSFSKALLFSTFALMCAAFPPQVQGSMCDGARGNGHELGCGKFHTKM